MTTTDATLQQLTEHIDDWCTTEVTIDEETRLVGNVALTGLKSRNGYRYAAKALREAVSLYEQKPVFLDHANNAAKPYDRSTRDLVGSIINPRFEDGRIRADIQVLDTEAGRTFLALAKTNGPAAGMSHVVLAERSQDGSLVERIREVISVDAVVFPATTSTFQEQRAQPTPCPGTCEALLAEIDRRLPDHCRRLGQGSAERVRRVGLLPEEVLVEVCPFDETGAQRYRLEWSLRDGELVLGEELTPCEADQIAGRQQENNFCLLLAGRPTDPEHSENEKLAALQEQLEKVTAERDRLRQELERFEQEERQRRANAEIDQLLAESNLPDYAVTNMLRRQLHAQSTREARRALLAERESLVQHCLRPVPLSRERPDSDSSRSDEEAIVAAVKQRSPSVLSAVG